MEYNIGIRVDTMKGAYCYFLTVIKSPGDYCYLHALDGLTTGPTNSSGWADSAVWFSD